MNLLLVSVFLLFPCFYYCCCSTFRWAFQVLGYYLMSADFYLRLTAIMILGFRKLVEDVLKFLKPVSFVIVSLGIPTILKFSYSSRPHIFIFFVTRIELPSLFNHYLLSVYIIADTSMLAIVNTNFSFYLFVYI